MATFLNFIDKQIQFIGSFFSKDQPLWLPPATIRSLMAVLIICCSTYAVLNNITLPEWWVAIAAYTIRDYMASRESTERTTSKIQEAVNNRLNTVNTTNQTLP